MKNIEILAQIYKAAVHSDDLAADVVARMEQAIGFEQIDIDASRVSFRVDSAELDPLFVCYPDQGLALVVALREMLEATEEATFRGMVQAGEAEFTADLAQGGDGESYFYFCAGRGQGLWATVDNAFEVDLPWFDHDAVTVKGGGVWATRMEHERRDEEAQV